MISVRHGCKSSIASKTKVYNVNPRWLLCDNGEFKLFFDPKSRLGWIMVPKAFPKPFQEVPRQGHDKQIGLTLTACGLKFDTNLIRMWAYERNRLSFRFANYLWRNNSRQPIRHLDIVPINQWDSEVKQPKQPNHVHETNILNYFLWYGRYTSLWRRAHARNFSVYGRLYAQDHVFPSSISDISYGRR